MEYRIISKLTLKEKNNIFLLVSNLSSGGAQRVVSVLSKGLSSLYHPYLVLHDGKRIDYSYHGKIIDLQTPVKKNILSKTVSFFKRIFKLKDLKHKLEPFAAISFLESSNFINLLSGGNGKTIISVRNIKSKQAHTLTGKLFHLLIRVMYGRSDLVAVPSEGIKAELVNLFKLNKDKIRVIYNPVDIEYIDKQAKAPLVGWEKTFIKIPFIITVGSLSRQKGQWHLIRAFHRLKSEIPDAGLLILGDGPLRPYLERLIEEYGLSESVMMPGFINNPFKLISKAHIFVFPSLFEGFPNALLEAMACRLPVLAADCQSGPRELLAPGSGYESRAVQEELVEYGILLPVCSGIKTSADKPLSKEELIMAEAMIKVLKEKDLNHSYSNLGRKRAEDFGLDKICRQWVDLIEE